MSNVYLNTTNSITKWTDDETHGENFQTLISVTTLIFSNTSITTQITKCQEITKIVPLQRKKNHQLEKFHNSNNPNQSFLAIKCGLTVRNLNKISVS